MPARRDRIKVVHIVKSLDIAGAETVVVNLLKNLDPDLFTPILVSLSGKGELLRSLANTDVVIYNTQQNSALARIIGISKLASILRKIKPDILHTHNFSASFYGRAAAIIANVPIIISSLHTYSHHQERKINRRIINSILLKFTDCIITVSDSIKNDLHKHHKIRPEMVRVIKNGIIFDNFAELPEKEASKKKFGLPPNQMVLGTLANLRQVKRIDVFIDVAKIILEHCPDMYFLVGGDGYLKNELMKHAHDLRIGKNIVFAGKIVNVPEFMSAIDIFASTSDREGLSLSILEAMSAGKACVVTKVGGNGELIIDGENGFIKEPGDSDGLATAILSLAKNPSLIDRFSAVSRSRVLSNFTVDKMAVDMAALYIEKIQEFVSTNLKN